MDRASVLACFALVSACVALPSCARTNCVQAPRSVIDLSSSAAPADAGAVARIESVADERFFDEYAATLRYSLGVFVTGGEEQI